MCCSVLLECTNAYLRCSFVIVYRRHRALSVTRIFYAGEVGIPCGGWCNEADFTEIPRNPGGTEHAQTVCTSLFFLRPRTRAWERGYQWPKPRLTVSGPTKMRALCSWMFSWHWHRFEHCHNFLPRIFANGSTTDKTTPTNQDRLHTPRHVKWLCYCLLESNVSVPGSHIV